MEPIRQIALVIAPDRGPPEPEDPHLRSSRALHRYDEFAAALRLHARFDVTIIENDLCTAPGDAFVLLDEGFDYHALDGCDAHLPRRALILNSERPPAILDVLEEWKAAGAVPGLRYFDWKHHRDKEGGGGLYGLRSVAARMGVTPPERGLKSPNYIMLGSERYKDLPELVAAYIDAFAELWPTIAAP